jgi:hypothetical protein
MNTSRRRASARSRVAVALEEYHDDADDDATDALPPPFADARARFTLATTGRRPLPSMNRSDPDPIDASARSLVVTE